MQANWITLSRFPLLLIVTLLLYLGSPSLQIVGAGLLLLGLLLDTVDGIVARKTGQSSLFGSVLDIAADRTYELVLWVCFADLGMVPTAIPLIVLARTTLTDALRCIGVARGAAPFDQERSALGRFLVSSAWMRTSYAASKIISFCGLALAHPFASIPSLAYLTKAEGPFLGTLRLTAWITVVLCVVRGLPVISGSRREHWRQRQPDPV
jgi:CDP-diacylglycerol--glycerol-3-phosphate 3-phosphatidyltransferase